MAKKFYIFEKIDRMAEVPDSKDQLIFHRTFDGTVVDAREAIGDDAFADGTYLILEDTSGEIVKGTDTIVKRTVKFDPPRKLGPRKKKTEAVAPPADEAAPPDEITKSNARRAARGGSRA